MGYIIIVLILVLALFPAWLLNKLQKLEHGDLFKGIEDETEEVE